MAQIDWSKYPPIPGFDCVAMKREIQAKIYEETKHMTPEERREYTRKKQNVLTITATSSSGTSSSGSLVVTFVVEVVF